MSNLRAPFPYFGGKRSIGPLVWSRFGRVKQYLEPFAGSLAVLLAAPEPAKLEVVGDQNHYVANFWRALKNHPGAVIEHADHPVVHVDLTARHRWLVEPERVAELRANLLDADWPGDAKLAGWWAWGLCAWIGSGWCDGNTADKVPHSTDRGRGVHRPMNRNQVPFTSETGQGMTRPGRLGELRTLSARLQRAVVLNADWTRCVNTHYGRLSNGTAAMFLDPPYKKFEALYTDREPVAAKVEQWCREHTKTDRLRMALCGHVGDYDLPGWEVVVWSRDSTTYGSSKTKEREAVWFSPQCKQVRQQLQLLPG